MQSQQIQEFNEQLIQENRDITIIDYVKELNNKYFNIDISFIDDFIDMDKIQTSLLFIIKC